MCVILHAKNKKHMKRDEVVQAMKANSSGFFMIAINKDRKNLIRTLKEDELLKFFDETVKDTDEVVMHARIPSYGPLNLDNVHGWEEDNIYFCHNMSIRAADGFRDMFPDWKNKTDSEFFFKKMFIPYYRGLGKDAYKDGKLHPDLDRFVKWMCGTTNKFCFIMPDGQVLRFGTWVTEPDRKEGNEIAFYASNTTYKVFKPAWSEKGGKKAASTAGFRRTDYDDADDYYGYGYGYDYDSYWNWKPAQPTTPVSPDAEGKTLRKYVSYQELAQCVLSHLVLQNITDTIDIDAKEDDVTNYARTLAPTVWTDDLWDVIEEGMIDCADITTDCSGMLLFLDLYSDVLADSIRKQCKVLTPITIKASMDKLHKEMRTLARAVNARLWFQAEAAEDFAVCYIMDDNDGMAQLLPEDLLQPRTMTYRDAINATDNLLILANLTDDEIQQFTTDAEEETEKSKKDKENGK